MVRRVLGKGIDDACRALCRGTSSECLLSMSCPISKKTSNKGKKPKEVSQSCDRLCVLMSPKSGVCMSASKTPQDILPRHTSKGDYAMQKVEDSSTRSKLLTLSN